MQRLIGRIGGVGADGLVDRLDGVAGVDLFQLLVSWGPHLFGQCGVVSCLF